MHSRSKYVNCGWIVAMAAAVPGPAIAQASGASDPMELIPFNSAVGKYTLLGADAAGDLLVGYTTDPNDPTGRQFVPFKWTAAGGLVRLGKLNGGTTAQARAVNAAGNVIVGWAEDGAGKPNAQNVKPQIAFRWTEQNGMESLGWLYQDPDPAKAGHIGNTLANSVDASGNVIVGTVQTADNSHRSIFIWTPATKMVDLGTLNNGRGRDSNGLGVDAGAPQVSADGQVIVGWSRDGDANNAVRAFRWTTTDRTMTSLGLLNPTDTQSLATAVNANGNFVAGYSTSSVGVQHGFRWAADDGKMTDLGFLEHGGNIQPTATSAAGDVIVGNAKDSSGANRGFRWSASSAKMQTIEAWLAENGIVTTEKTSSARTVSADGQVVSGVLSSSSGAIYIARVISPPAPVADPAPAAPSISAADPDAVKAAGSAEPAAAEGGAPAAVTPRSSPPAPRAAGHIGSGLILPQSFNRGLASVAQSKQISLDTSELVMNGMHSNPMRMLLPTGKSAFWTAGDLGRAEHGDHDNDQGVAEIGFAHRLHDRLQLNLSAGRSFSRAKTDLGGRTIARSTYLMPEVILSLPASLYMTLSGYYGRGTADIERGYLNAGRREFASASPDQRSAGARLRLDWKDAVAWTRTSLTPYSSLTYLETRSDGYTERGGAFPARWDRRIDRATTARLGVDVVHELSSSITLQGRLEGAHRFDRTGAGASGEVIGLYAFNFDGPRTMRNWLRVGAGAEAQVGSGVAGLMLNATTRGEAPSYWASVNYRWQF